MKPVVQQVLQPRELQPGSADAGEGDFTLESTGTGPRPLVLT